nr:MBOAT family O-acyltransferase [Flavobacterium sp. MK4S-17]
MLFNTLDFAIFFPIVFIGYWFIFNRSLRLQNIFLLLSSYFFYACWDWRFMFLLLFSTVLDFYSGEMISKAQSNNQKKIWLWTSIGINLGFLMFFKYFNFFIETFAGTFSLFGYTISGWTLNILLPVGISFYTFHGLSYVIDIYNNRIKPEGSFINYSLFVSFFPLLVAGPIERATHLLPQIKNKRIFRNEEAIAGLKQILWGLFKKVVIADNCAKYADIAFNNTEGSSGSTLVLGAVFFAFQIYGDFSGYTDIALGSARLLGIKLLRNFSYPYFSVNIAEFWRKWHISLSSWFRDYVYIPLGGSRVTRDKQIRNVFIVFVLSGFWHGANWTFIIWGILHFLYFLPLLLLNRNRKINEDNKNLPDIKTLANIIITFIMVTFAWIFFRAENINHAFSYISGIFSGSFFSVPELFPKTLLLTIAIFVVLEWRARNNEIALDSILHRTPLFLRYAVYYFILFLVFYYSSEQRQFIYFQF